MPTRAPTISSLKTGGVRPLDTRPTPTARGYSSKWANYSTHYLHQHPLCVACRADGLVVSATLVDHIVPLALGGSMWDPKNHQGLCRSCHATKTGRERRAARRRLMGVTMVTGRLASVLCLAVLLALAGCLATRPSHPVNAPASIVRPSLPQQEALSAIPRATLVPPSNPTDLQALPVARISRSEHVPGGQSVIMSSSDGPNSVVSAVPVATPDARIRSPSSGWLVLVYLAVVLTAVGWAIGFAHAKSRATRAVGPQTKENIV